MRARPATAQILRFAPVTSGEAHACTVREYARALVLDDCRIRPPHLSIDTLEARREVIGTFLRPIADWGGVDAHLNIRVRGREGRALARMWHDR